MHPFRYLLSWLLIGLSFGLVAQSHADVTFDARVSRDRMLVSSTLEYQVTLRNANGTDFTEPQFRDFDVISGPGLTRGTNITNGVRTTYISYSWLLKPKRTGTLNVEPATIRANGRTYRSNSVSVEALAVDAGLASLAPDNFLRLEVSDDTAYVGQQILLNLRLYTTDNVVSRNLVAEPDLSAFFAYPRRQFDGRTQTVLDNGKEYLARTIASIALYPSKSGDLIIEPYRLLLGVIRYRNPQSSFSRRYTERIPLQTDTLNILVNELPRPRPDNFSGGVGRLRTEFSVDKDSLSTDDAVTLRMSVSGEGDVKRITTPLLVPEKDWVIYDPEVLLEEFNDTPTGIYGRKVLEYRIVPKRPGEYDLQPTLNYFDVDSNAYVSLAPLVYPLNVTAGTNAVVYNEEEIADTTEVLSLLPGKAPRKLRRYGGAGMPPLLFWGLVGLPLLFLGGWFGLDWRRRQLADRDPRELARERAARMANDRLKAAESARQSGQAKAFYDAVEDAILGYVRDKFQLPVAELTKKNIHRLLLDKGAEEELANAYVSLLKRCEMALYAGQDGAGDLAATYDTARDLILRTEKIN